MARRDGPSAIYLALGRLVRPQDAPSGLEHVLRLPVMNDALRGWRVLPVRRATALDMVDHCRAGWRGFVNLDGLFRWCTRR